jgi:hypothetical protein
VKNVLAAVTIALLMASGADSCNRPGDKTPANAEPIVEVIMEVTVAAAAPEVWANVKIHVRDHSGQPAVDIATGELYPTEHPRRLPYKHFVVHPLHVSATYSIEATIGGVPGDILGCAMYINGVKLQEIGTPHVTTIPEGGRFALVYCEYTRYAVN